MSKPPKLGTVWTSAAWVKVIDDSCDPPRWKTLSRCINTPNAIDAELAKVRKVHPNETLWVHTDLGDKYIPEGVKR